jgi:hypothetical protein
VYELILVWIYPYIALNALETKEHMSMFIVKYIVIQIKGRSRNLSNVSENIIENETVKKLNQ